MQVQQLPIYQFLGGPGKSFVIPVYQRDYAWTRINCQKLWGDLLDLNKNNRLDHFLGTVVTIGSNFDEYTVIDGQQRLTTTSILLIALYNYLKNKQDKTNDENNLTEQTLEFLVNRYSQDDKKIRLKPNKQDKEYFDKLFKQEIIDDVNSNIVSNYNYFYDKISSLELSPIEIFNAFRKLKIVLIDLVRGQDDPQLIFESLNSTGVDLTAGDLIRNYILMDLNPNDQESMYRNYWIRIEKLTGNIAEFVRNYLIFKSKLWVKKDDVYNVFKKFSLDVFDRNKIDILTDLLAFAEIYSWLVQIQKHSNMKINKQLERLNKLEFTVSHPYLLDVFNDLKSNKITEEILINILKTIESYAFRKILVDNTTQGLNKMFITLSREIKKEDLWEQNYLNILNYIILEKRVSQRFPTDEEFENTLITKEVYRLQAKNRNFLLESLENYNSAYIINIDDLSIEHIMPQTLTVEWKTKLGEYWQDIHKKYLHTLGNLSLTAKNSELSNNNFENKQQIDFQLSKLNLNFKLNGLNDWNETEIIDRSKQLIQNAKMIWAYPKTTFIKSRPDEQIFDLTTEDSFSGSKPSHLFIANIENPIEIKNWRDLLINVCNFLYNFSPTQFHEIQNSEEFKWYFNVDKPLRHPQEFFPNKFVEGNISANALISFLFKVCERLNYPAENISFSIKEIRE